PQVDDGLGEPTDHGGKLSLERPHGRAHRLARAGVDEIRDRLSLGEVQLVVEEGALSEFTRQRAARTELRDPGDQCFEYQGSSMTVQFEDVLAGVGVRSGEEERQAGIDRLLRVIEEAGEARAAG